MGSENQRHDCDRPSALAQDRAGVAHHRGQPPVHQHQANERQHVKEQKGEWPRQHRERRKKHRGSGQVGKMESALRKRLAACKTPPELHRNIEVSQLAPAPEHYRHKVGGNQQSGGAKDRVVAETFAQGPFPASSWRRGRRRSTYAGLRSMRMRRYSSPHRKLKAINARASMKRGEVGCHSSLPRNANRIVPGIMPITLAQK
jgi:hypothetical protein